MYILTGHKGPESVDARSTMETTFTINSSGEICGTTEIASTKAISGAEYSGFDFEFLMADPDKLWYGTMHLVLFNDKYHIIEHFMFTHGIQPGNVQKFDWKDKVHERNISHIKSYSIHFTYEVPEIANPIDEVKELPSEQHLHRRNAVVDTRSQKKGFKSRSIVKNIKKLFKPHGGAPTTVDNVVFA